MLLPIPGSSAPQTRPRLVLPGAPDAGLARGRVHEFCGPAALTLAAATLGQDDGPVVWTFPAWTNGRINPPGLASLAHPGRLILARARRAEDILWTLEEALRSGTVPIVVGELPALPELTPVRRLQLAAEAGAEVARRDGTPAPVGLLLTPGDGGAAGIESRWHLAPRPSDPAQAAGGRRLWRLERRRARLAPPAAWVLQRDGADGFSTTPVPPEGDQGPIPAT